MIKALADQIAAIEEGISQHQWHSRVRAILISLITTIREQDKEITRLTDEHDQSFANQRLGKESKQ